MFLKYFCTSVPFLLIGCANGEHLSHVTSNIHEVTQRVFANNVGRFYKGKPWGYDLYSSQVTCYVIGPAAGPGEYGAPDEIWVHFGKDLMDAFVPNEESTSQSSFRGRDIIMGPTDWFGWGNKIKGRDASGQEVVFEFDPSDRDRLTWAIHRVIGDKFEDAKMACTDLKEVSPSEVAPATEEYKNWAQRRGR